MGSAKDNIDAKKLTSWKLLDNFRQRLAKAQAAAPKLEKRPGGPERLLLEEDYFSLFLFGRRLLDWVTNGKARFSGESSPRRFLGIAVS